MICPAEKPVKDIDIRQIFKVVIEDDMAECAPFVDAFWSVVDSLTLAEKRLFLVFVTGVEMPPEPGTERLVIQFPFSAFSQEEHVAMLSMLPQAHTCTNTLELPNYYEALQESGTLPEDCAPKVLTAELKRLLGEKMRVAIRESAGYELDAIEPQGNQFAASPNAAVVGASPKAVVPKADVQPAHSSPEAEKAVQGGERDSSSFITSPAFEQRDGGLPPLQPIANNQVGGIDALLQECDLLMASPRQEPQQVDSARDKNSNIDNLIEELELGMADSNSVTHKEMHVQPAIAA